MLVCCRCNGIAQPGRGGMVRRNVHINNNAMPPNRGHSISDTKLKFSDRLKAYLSSDRIRSDSTGEVDDPYQFSDSEAANNANKKCLLPEPKADCVKNNKVYVLNGSNGGSVGGVKSENSSSHGKTMSRLQAQIARNKVTVKHNRSSPDPKGELATTVKETKRSIIGECMTRTRASSTLSHCRDLDIDVVLNLGCANPLSLAVQSRLASGCVYSCVSLGLVQSKDQERRDSGRKLQAPSGKPLPAALRARRASSKGTHHEGSIQRIRAFSGDDSTWHAPATAENTEEAPSNGISAPVYQRHWFCRELELLSDFDGPREARLELTRAELKRHLVQMTGSKVGRHRSQEEGIAMVSAARTSTTTPSVYPSTGGAIVGPVGRTCSGDSCSRPALPCTSHCPLHIMSNSDQVLFDYCTAKFADNTQCSVPVFDIAHELPLCTEHARKRDNYNKMCLETKPKKARRKIKPSAMIRPQKRNKKRKRVQSKSSEQSSASGHQPSRNSFSEVSEPVELNVCETSSAYESSEDVGLGTLSESEFVTIKEEDTHHHMGK